MHMNDFGFIRTAAACPTVKVANCSWNIEEICTIAKKASAEEVSLLVFPELSVTGSTCGSLFLQSTLIRKAEEGIQRLIEFSQGKEMTIIAGVPVLYRSRLYNCAAVIRNGKLEGLVPNVHASAPFASGCDFLCEHSGNETEYAGQRCIISTDLLFETGHATFAVEFGDDLHSPVPQSSYKALQGAQIIVCPAAESEILMRDRHRNRALEEQSAKAICGYVFASAGLGESSQDHAFAGAASIWENGNRLAEAERFATSSSLIIADIDMEALEASRRESAIFKNALPSGTAPSSLHRPYSRMSLGKPAETDFSKVLHRYIEPHPFVPENDLDYRCREILSIQVQGLLTRLRHINCSTAVIGISGGLDSTLALLVTALAFEKLGWSNERIVAVTMPGFGTTSRTKNNAWDLMKALGVTCREISIAAACRQHFSDIGHNEEVHDATYENSQARERTQILMDIANQTGGIVVGTGDLSELALGWATYNGDHMSMYGVNAGVPKTLVRSLVKWAAENKFEAVKDILMDIVDTPISPELLPADENGKIKQVTEDLVGPYELHDFFIYNFMRFGFGPEKILFLAERAFAGTYDKETIEKWLKTFIRRFFSQQFKRSCMPDGPKVGSVGLSPRGDWAMPSDAWSNDFQL